MLEGFTKWTHVVKYDGEKDFTAGSMENIDTMFCLANKKIFHPPHNTSIHIQLNQCDPFESEKVKSLGVF